MKKGSCARISAEEYERQGREYKQNVITTSGTNEERLSKTW